MKVWNFADHYYVIAGNSVREAVKVLAFLNLEGFDVNDLSVMDDDEELDIEWNDADPEFDDEDNFGVDGHKSQTCRQWAEELGPGVLAEDVQACCHIGLSRMLWQESRAQRGALATQ